MFRAAGADPADISFQSHRLDTSGLIIGHAAAFRRARARRVTGATGLLLCCLAAPLGDLAQNPAATPAGTSSPQPASKPAAGPQQIPRVTTTVVVHGETPGEYLPEVVTVGNLDGIPLVETPQSVTVITRDMLSDQGALLLSDVVGNDASVGDDYVPVGYYGVYEIRGFAIDLATGLQINGMTIAGEQGAVGKQGERRDSQGHCRRGERRGLRGRVD